MARKAQCNALITLYDTEITRCLEQVFRDPEKAGGLVELLCEGRIEEIRMEFEGDASGFAKKLFAELKMSPLSLADEQRLYMEFMVFLQENMRNSEIHRLLKCSDEAVRRSEFKILLNHLDEFLRFTDPREVLKYLDAYPQYYDVVQVLRIEMQHLQQTLAERQQNTTGNEHIMGKLLLRTVPILGNLAIYEILFVIYFNSSQNLDEEAKSFVNRVLQLKPGQFDAFYNCH
uniref:Uncharacterized protein n=1 Tax=Caenorhabditis japonica TaxID=281687 RepID=A0A8R1IMQ9_CAEJA